MKFNIKNIAKKHDVKLYDFSNVQMYIFYTIK